MEFTKENLKEINVYSLRSLARQIGVKSPSTLNKQKLIDEIIEINNGSKTPNATKKVGRPPKSFAKVENVIDKKIINEEEIKKKFIDKILKEIEKKLNEIL